LIEQKKSLLLPNKNFSEYVYFFFDVIEMVRKAGCNDRRWYTREEIRYRSIYSVNV